MEYRLLGPLEVVGEGGTIALGGPRQRAVLALLLLNAGHVVSTDRLIDELWGDDRPETAKTVLQGFVSNLRKALGAGAIRTRAPGYVIEPGPGELDLERFERLLHEGREALSREDPDVAAQTLRAGLSLWRGLALADFAYERFAQSSIVRLEELRLTALEERIDADMALGRHAEVIGELEALIVEHPLRERPRAQLMLALYRAGRQANALDTYQDARRVLVDELGIEPTPALQDLERAILRHDPALEAVRVAHPPPTAPSADGSRPERAILVVVERVLDLDVVLALAEPLGRRPPRELILALLVREAEELMPSTPSLHERRDALLARGVAARAAVFTSEETGSDAVRLAAEQDVDLLLLASPLEALEGEVVPTELARVLADAPCDVAVLVLRAAEPELGLTAPVVVPFGGAEHEWAAVEIGAWLAAATGTPLRLAGVAADTEKGRRDASRLLATASLAVQQVSGVAPEPVIVAPGPEGIVGVAESAGLVVMGLSDRWRQEGLGPGRLAVARDARPSALLVRGGVRPGGLAPSESVSRFTWTLGGRAGEAPRG